MALGRPAESMLAIALSNLLRNALERTEDGEVSVRVDADETAVTDTGRGEEPRRAFTSPGLEAG